MTIIYSVNKSSLNFDDRNGCQMKEKNWCLKALALFELAKGCLNVTPLKGK